MDDASLIGLRRAKPDRRYIHSFPKPAAKILVSRLAPRRHELVLANQNAFIRGRAIQHNFFQVQQTVKFLHRKCIPSFFLKRHLKGL